ncbi:MAG: phage portal protein [Gemmatimonadetes bacterium]|nr:phage portal protein [Gemmatimonadota bacterium]
MAMADIFPFRRPDPEPAQENRNYTDIVTQALVDAASEPLLTGYTAALEIAAGQLSRVFAAATVAGAGAPAFDSWMLAQVARSLVESGDAVWYRIGRRLVRAEQYGINPDGTYELTLPERSVVQPSRRVFHARWNIDVSSARGLAPLETAQTIRQLLQKLEGSLAQESGAAVGYLLPVPSDGDDAAVEKLKQDLAALKGRIAVVETTRGGWGEGPTGSPRRDYDLARMGPNIPDGNVRMFQAARDSVLAACGYPVQLAQGQGDGTAQREAWRRYLHGTVAPIGNLVEVEAARIGLPITISWDRLFASDIQGRARAFQSLVAGGMSLEAAAAASGILGEDT